MRAALVSFQMARMTNLMKSRNPWGSWLTSSSVAWMALSLGSLRVMSPPGCEMCTSCLLFSRVYIHLLPSEVGLELMRVAVEVVVGTHSSLSLLVMTARWSSSPV